MTQHEKQFLKLSRLAERSEVRLKHILEEAGILIDELTSGLSVVDEMLEQAEKKAKR